MEEAGGQVDKFIGDGVMALFGIGRAPAEAAARRSTRPGAWRRISSEMNAALSRDLAEPLRIGIGIHAGPAIVGEMGYGAPPRSRRSATR